MPELPEVMTAAVTTGHGGPETIELHHDWPVPAPATGEALIRVTAAGVNNTDLWSRQGAYGTVADPDAVVGWRGVPLDFPRIQGGDIAGVVVAVGDSAYEHWLGRRVLVDPAAEYSDGYPSAIVGSEVDGGFAQYHISSVVRVHDVTGSPLSDEQLACLPIAYATALGMVERAECQAGERVLVTGASGGVGLAAMQIAASRNCRVVAYTSPEKAAMVAQSGAEEVIMRGRDNLEDLHEVSVILDVVGGDEFPTVLGRLGDGGRLATAGAIAGPLVNLDLRRLYLRNRRLIGSTMHTPELFREMVELARRGAVDPRVAATYPLTEFAAAQARFERKDFVGKLILLPAEG
jgi:NADPH:quinone reductase-like Zn-dependent oxidoreductase